MTDSLIPHIRRSHQTYRVEAAEDPEELRRTLEPQRLFAAYALAQLEPGLFRLSEWWTSQTAQGLSLVCHSRGGLGEATFLLGPPAGIAAILSIHPGAYQTFTTAKPEHLEALKSVYRLSGTRVMRRLHVKRQRFEAVEGTATRLRGAHVRTLNRLYSSEGGLTAYQAHHIDEGCYYGVVEEGRLVAVAGTHAISPTHGIAVVGNVFTHPLYRGRGHATVATSAVTAELLESHRDVVLSVDPGNTPAIQAYNLLGYEDCGEIVEAAGRRRASGLMSGLRRLRAAIRGHKDGAEIVRIASH